MPTPLIYSYLKKYQDDPKSRIFAPLAEAYRKAGLVDEAIEIAREGLEVHPHFIGGRVALARALFEKKSYAEVLQELEQIIHDVPDNLVAQKIYAESSLMLGHVANALNAYKMLLYFNPNDSETAQVVAELETQAFQKNNIVLDGEPNLTALDLAFDVRPAKSAIKGMPKEESVVETGQWMKQIQHLQNLLQRVERYRQLTDLKP